MIIEVSSKKAPQVVGAYSQAISYGNLVFCSGQIGKEPVSDVLKVGIEAQTRQVMENLKEVLKAAGSSFDQVLKVTVYLKKIADFPKMNEIYAGYFGKPYPARATIEVTGLPKDALIEIECIAYKDD